ncbi:hypothetical protein [Mycobacterium sp.]|uniref:hypothetical protein n=1 Tax=Mycobacterium sp. TaxID=1785 RepID=UPI0025E5D73F|nr:hypothetical protein [Mycobacterium sp.]
MRRSWSATIVLCGVAVLAGCSATSSNRSAKQSANTAAPPAAPVEVTIPVARTDTEVDQTYEIQSTASVINDVWADGTFGKISVMARRGVSKDNYTPLLTGILKFKDGSTVECRQFRLTMWNNFESFEPLALRCSRAVDLSATQSATVISAHGAAEKKRSGG